MMKARVGILLCTFNGARFIGEQLHSIEQQTFPCWSLSVADDGSTDGTLKVVNQFRARHAEHCVLRSGASKGFAWNFLSLTASPSINAEYWAFCDQDDVWEADKLARAIDRLSHVAQEVPALYCSRTLLIDDAGQVLGMSPRFSGNPGFGNALVQNIVSGNTMVFNERARQLLVKAAASDVPFHDWLLYAVVSGCGGEVVLDLQPTVRYRQHNANVLGPWGSWRAHLLRMKLLLGGQVGVWIETNSQALKRIESELTPAARAMLARFYDGRSRPMIARLCMFYRNGIRHHSWGGNAGLALAVMLGKL